MVWLHLFPLVFGQLWLLSRCKISISISIYFKDPNNINKSICVEIDFEGFFRTDIAVKIILVSAFAGDIEGSLLKCFEWCSIHW